MVNAWVAIFGSLDPTRSDLEIKLPENAKVAAKHLGRALADRGCGIIVYSGDPAYVETDVVSGFVESEKAQPESILVVYARKTPQPQFKEQAIKPSCFKFKMDSNHSWEVSFYRSLFRVDGVALIGGGQSTFVAGILAVASGLPVVALEAYGGAASGVWELLTPSESLLTQDEKDAMAEESPSASWAERIVGSLLAQMARRKDAFEMRTESARARRRTLAIEAGISALLLFSALGLFVWTWDAQIERSRLLTAIVAAPILAGASASVIRTLWERAVDSVVPQGRPAWLMALLGSVAGAISGLLYVIAQLTALPGNNGSLAPIAGRLVPFALLTGFLAGFAMDAFFRRIRDQAPPEVQLPQFRVPERKE